MRTAEEYRQSLREMRPNIYKFGELIEDPTSSPYTRRTVEGHAQTYEAAMKDEYRDIFVTESSLTGEPISRYLSVIRSAEDHMANCKLKRTMYNLTGTCTGGRCVGWNCINAMWATTYEIDQAEGTDYHQRLRKWLEDAQRRDITLAGALTDAKGDRSKSPTQQEDPDLYVRIVERRDDGIVVRGAKTMICGVAAANEIFILPGRGMKEDMADYAVSFVIPRDIEGLTIVETRRPSDKRELEEGFDCPVEIGGITQAYLLFEDVFVPNERVFMAGEWKYPGGTVMNFIGLYRSAIGGCVAGQGDVMVGASALMARANGISEKAMMDKLNSMMINNETTYGMGVAAAALGKQHPSGSWIPDPVLSNVNKVYVGTLPYETKRLAQEIGGGIAETGCLPSYKDINDPRYGELLKKYLKANSSAESRARLARLIEWLTLGAGVPGCMHGGGSPDTARRIIWSMCDTKGYMEMAKRLAGIDEDIPEPVKKR